MGLGHAQLSQASQLLRCQYADGPSGSVVLRHSDGWPAMVEQTFRFGVRCASYIGSKLPPTMHLFGRLGHAQLSQASLLLRYEYADGSSACFL